MFERYTDNARRMIFRARAEAQVRASLWIEPEHLLLAILLENPDGVAGFFPNKHEVEGLLRGVREALPPPSQPLTPSDLPLSHPCKRVLAYGAEESQRAAHRHIGIEHNVLGLLREPSLASRILEKHGVTLQSGREYVRSLAG